MIKLSPNSNLAPTSQEEFHQALLSPKNVLPAGVVGPNGEASQKRFGIFRNNVASSLIEALGANFPAVKRLLGATLFDNFAHAYMQFNMPKNPVLINFGTEFPEFLESFEPAAQLPYLADVARVEIAWLRAYHAADDPVLDGQRLGEISINAVGQARFAMHPASWIRRSQWPMATIVTRNRELGDCSDIDLSIGEDVLITRPKYTVETRVLPVGGFEFLTALSAGMQLQQAATSALKCHAGAEDMFDLAEHIKGMLHCGVFSSIQGQQDTESG